MSESREPDPEEAAELSRRVRSLSEMPPPAEQDERFTVGDLQDAWRLLSTARKFGVRGVNVEAFKAPARP